MRRFVVVVVLGGVALMLADAGVETVLWSAMGHQSVHTDLGRKFGLALASDVLLTELGGDERVVDPAELAARLTASVEQLPDAAAKQRLDAAPFVWIQGGLEIAPAAQWTAERVAVVVRTPTAAYEVSAWDLGQRYATHKGVKMVSQVLLLCALGLVLVWRPAQHLRRLSTAAAALRAGDLSARANIGRRGLVAPFAQTFDAMAEGIEETMAWREHLLQTVAHELRTPLARARFVAERVADATEGAERDAALVDLDVELSELEDTLTAVLGLARATRGPEAPRQAVDLTEMVRDVVRTVRRGLDQDQRLVVIDVLGLDESSPPAFVEPASARRALRNVVENAVTHARSRVRVVGRAESDAIVITVDDDGPGIPAADRQRVLAPFVRLDSAGSARGTGLGLAIVQQIVRAHGFDAVVEASELGGAKVETRWPIR